MFNKTEELNNMANKAKRIEAGLYKYRGYSIENMKNRAAIATYTFWNIAKIPAGGDVYDAYEAHDCTNTLAEAKEFIDSLYHKGLHND
jgi:hypothetical protein